MQNAEFSGKADKRGAGEEKELRIWAYRSALNPSEIIPVEL